MSVSIPNGAIIGMASGYGIAVNITAISNASPAVATTAANTFAIGDFLEVTSGWSALNGRVVRAAAVSGTSVTLEGIDTTSVARYPVGGGVGSIRKVTGYTQLAQILTSASSGGEQQFLTYQFLEADNQTQIPTNKSAAALTFGVADDITQPGYILAKTANDDRVPRAVKITLKGGGIISHNAYISVSDTPSLNANELMQIDVTMSLVAVPVRY